MTNEARAGILALMTRLGEVDSCTLEQIPIFLKGLDKETVQKVLVSYDQVLANFYVSELIRDWITANVQILRSRNLVAANYFDKMTSEFKNELMWISVICELPSDDSDRQFYIENCQRIFNSKRHVLIIDCLQQMPTQQCMSLDQFYDTTCKLCQLEYDAAIEQLQVQFHQRPVIEWSSIIKSFQEKSPYQEKPSDTISKTLNLLVKEFGPVDKNAILNDFLHPDSLINTVLKMCNLAPNFYQSCVSAYQLFSLRNATAQFWDIPGGRGKSRIIHSTALMCLLTHHSVVHIVLPSKAQIRRETEEFKDFWINSDKVGQVIYHCDFEFDMGDDHIIICDEADQLMFQYTEKYFEKARKHEIISLTASIPYSEKMSHESVVMNKIYKVETPQFDAVLQPMSSTCLSRHLEGVTENQAVLIYCNNDQVDEVSKIQNSVRIDCDTDYKILRKLDDKHSTGRYPLCYTTESIAMRGFDYRAPNNGISLFIARSFQTERDFHQAMMRVGRFGDPKCKRFGFENVAKVDEELSQQLKKRLMSFIRQQKPIDQNAVQRAMTKPDQQHQKNQNQPTNKRTRELVLQSKLNFEGKSGQR